MVTSAELEKALIEALEPLASGENRDSGPRPIYVGDFDVKTALGCPRKYAHGADGPNTFERNVFTVHKSLARYAARRPKDISIELIKAEMADLRDRLRQGLDLGAKGWIAEYAFVDCDRNGRALLASYSAGWLARVRDCLGVDDMSAWTSHNKVAWNHPSGGLTLNAIGDFTTDDNALIHVGSASVLGRSAGAYIFLLQEIVRGSVASDRHIVDLRRRSIERMSIDEVISLGCAAAVTTIEAHHAARQKIPVATTPGFWSCRSCEALDHCNDGQSWLDFEPEQRAGIRVRIAK